MLRRHQNKSPSYYLNHVLGARLLGREVFSLPAKRTPKYYFPSLRFQESHAGLKDPVTRTSLPILQGEG
jgi:hypothetical protein